MINKVWGHEEVIVNSTYCGKILHLKEGYQCSLHHHKEKDETFYILEGEVEMEVGSSKTVMTPGMKVRIYPHTNHRFKGLAPSKILEISTHHEDGDSYRLEESRKC